MKKSYIFKKIDNRFIATEALAKLFADSESDEEKVRSTDLILEQGCCFELKNDEISLIEKTQEIINFDDLKILKEKKIKDLQNDYNNSKKIILQNGNTLIIEHDTKEREIFTENLENLKTISINKNSVLSYRQIVGNVYLGFSALSYIWKHLFLNKFTNERPSLTLESKRSKNKEILDVKKLKIENATSIEELQAITWSFEDITVININVEAQKLLDDPETPDYVIEAINSPELKGEDGQIHLIKIL